MCDVLLVQRISRTVKMRSLVSGTGIATGTGTGRGLVPIYGVVIPVVNGKIEVVVVVGGGGVVVMSIAAAAELRVEVVAGGGEERDSAVEAGTGLHIAEIETETTVIDVGTEIGREDITLDVDTHPRHVTTTVAPIPRQTVATTQEDLVAIGRSVGRVHDHRRALPVIVEVEVCQMQTRPMVLSMIQLDIWTLCEAMF